MNNVQRRLFRAFAESGGDLSDDEQVQHFIRRVESQLTLLPPKVRAAVEVILRAADETSYEHLAAELGSRERQPLRIGTLRRRVSRGACVLEDVIRRTALGKPLPSQGLGLSSRSAARKVGNGRVSG